MRRTSLSEREARELCALAGAVLGAMGHGGLGTMVSSVMAHDLGDRSRRLQVARNYLGAARWCSGGTPKRCWFRMEVAVPDPVAVRCHTFAAWVLRRVQPTAPRPAHASEADSFLVSLARAARIWAAGTEVGRAQALAQLEREAPAHRHASSSEWTAAFAMIRIIEERLSGAWGGETGFRFDKMAEIATGQDGSGTARARVVRVAGDFLYEAHMRTAAEPWKPRVVRVRRRGQALFLHGDAFQPGDEVLETWTAGECVIRDGTTMRALSTGLERLRDLNPRFAVLSLEAKARYLKGSTVPLHELLLRALKVKRRRPGGQARPSKGGAAKHEPDWSFAMSTYALAGAFWKLAGMEGGSDAKNFDAGLRKRAASRDKADAAKRKPKVGTSRS